MMAHAESTVVIARSPADVFDFLADGTNNSKWRQGVTDVSLVSGDGAGSVYKQTMRGPGGRSIAGDYRVTELDRPRLLRFEVIAGPARPTGAFRLEPAEPTGTRVTFTLDLQPAGVMKLMAPMITKQVRREVTALEDLKRVLEQDSA